MNTFFQILGIIFIVVAVIWLLIGAWQYMCLVIQHEMPLGFKEGLKYILLWPLNYLMR